MRIGLASVLLLVGCGGDPVPPGPDTRLAALPAPYNTADYANGRSTFRLCTACHRLGSDTQHRVGPNLSGVFGREAGVALGFRYSQALQDAEFVWTPERLDEWLRDPEYFLPGNNMRFLGVDDPQDRIDLIAYLLVETAID